MTGIFTRWKNLSVSKKLYAVVGVMAFLIAAELFTLLFAMNTLSSVRAFVGGEGLWSKAQKNAVHSLEKYAVSKDEIFYREFKENLRIPMGDHQARMELMKPDMNFELVKEGFVSGGNHPDDIRGMVTLMRRFYWVDHLARAIAAWEQGDKYMFQLMELGDRLHELHKNPTSDPNEIPSILNKVYVLNKEITVIEDAFSSTLGEASRWLESILMIVLIALVSTIESTGLFLTFLFSQGLTRTLKELNSAAIKVGSGDFSQTVPVRSQDELGQLAHALNTMTKNLRLQVSERLHAEHASQAKNLFLANMSHEIRTPLNAILGFTDLLRDHDISDNERKQYLDIVKRTGNNLNTIVNDILDVSKVEAEKMEIEKSAFSLAQLLADLDQLFKIKCEEKGILLEIAPKGKTVDFIYSDSSRLRQILLNIVGNAIKFTERGGVSISYELNGRHILFTVSDSGTGISEEQKNRLFKTFSQADLSIRKKYGGAGLGLILSQRLAQLLGGDVGLVESKPGQGSVFYIKIAHEPVVFDARLRDITAQHLIPSEGLSLQNKKLLVVEDTKENQLLLQVYLTRCGAMVETANNGVEGVEKALQIKFDLILMDMQMPIKDGYEATRELRERGFQTPIIAITGYAMKHDREKCLDVGCTDYLSKPVDRNKLIQLVASHL